MPRLRELHLGELLEERVVLLEAHFGFLEELVSLFGPDLLHELLEARMGKRSPDRFKLTLYRP